MEQSPARDRIRGRRHLPQPLRDSSGIVKTFLAARQHGQADRVGRVVRFLTLKNRLRCHFPPPHAFAELSNICMLFTLLTERC